MKKTIFVLLFFCGFNASAVCLNFLKGQEPTLELVEGGLSDTFTKVCLDANSATLISTTGQKYEFEGTTANDRSNTQYSFIARSGVALIDSIKLSVGDLRIGTYLVTLDPNKNFGGKQVRANAIVE